jgi:hypothetical protein
MTAKNNHEIPSDFFINSISLGLLTLSNVVFRNRNLLVGLDSITISFIRIYSQLSSPETLNASQYYTDKVNIHKKKYLKLSTGVEVLSQIDSMFYQDKESSNKT